MRFTRLASPVTDLTSADFELKEDGKTRAVLKFEPMAEPLSVAVLGLLTEVARETPEVVECHRVTGEDCFYMKLHVRSVEHLEEVIDRFTPYGQTTTSIIQSSPVARRGLELGA